MVTRDEDINNDNVPKSEVGLHCWCSYGIQYLSDYNMREEDIVGRTPRYTWNI